VASEQSRMYTVKLDVGTAFSRGDYEKTVPANDEEHAIGKVRAMARREHLAVHGVIGVDGSEWDD
jgi:hypothetical protein